MVPTTIAPTTMRRTTKAPTTKANCPIRNSDQLDKYMGAGQGGIALFLCNGFEKSGICKDKCSTIRHQLK